jgi:chorismate synthase
MHSISSFLDNKDSAFHETEQPLFLSNSSGRSPNRITVSRSVARKTLSPDTPSNVQNFLVYPEQLDFSVVKDNCIYSMQLFVMMKEKHEEIRELMNKGMEERESSGYFGKVKLILPSDPPEIHINKVHFNFTYSY